MRTPEIIILCTIAMLTIGSVFWIWMLIDCALNRAIKQGPKSLWMVFILLTHWIGALIYFFTGRRLRNRPNQVAYQPYAQSQEHYQIYQHGYRSPESYSPPFDEDKTSLNSRRKRRRNARTSAQYEQPQASYPKD
jgi:hypothetical protein